MSSFLVSILCLLRSTDTSRKRATLCHQYKRIQEKQTKRCQKEVSREDGKGQKGQEGRSGQGGQGGEGIEVRFL